MDARFITGAQLSSDLPPSLPKRRKRSKEDTTAGLKLTKKQKELRELLRDHEKHGMDEALRTDVAKAMSHGDRYRALALQGLGGGLGIHLPAGHPRWALYMNVTLRGPPSVVAFWAPVGHLGPPLGWHVPPGRGCAVSYSTAEYERGVVPKDPLWDRAKTDRLFAFSERFGLRWCVIHDRWGDASVHGAFTKQQLMARYYTVAASVVRHRLHGPEGQALWLQHPFSALSHPIVVPMPTALEEEQEVMARKWRERYGAGGGRHDIATTDGTQISGHGQDHPVHPALRDIRDLREELVAMVTKRKNEKPMVAPRPVAPKLPLTKPAVFGRAQDLIFAAPGRAMSAIQKDADKLLSRELENSFSVASEATERVIGELREVVMGNLAIQRNLVRVQTLQKKVLAMEHRLDSLEKEYGGASFGFSGR